MFLRENSDTEIRPMARPVRFEWDDYKRPGKLHPHDRSKEMRTAPQVASVESVKPPYREIHTIYQREYQGVNGDANMVWNSLSRGHADGGMR